MRFLKVNLLLLTLCFIASLTALDSKIVLAGGDPSIKDSKITKKKSNITQHDHKKTYLKDQKKLSTKDTNKISNTKTKFLVAGLFQCLAFLPGFSRSGSCMIAFRMMGEDRKNSSVLSLYLGMPIILISFLSNLADLEEIKFDFNLLIIFVVTFVFAYLTLKLFINFINNIGFKPFVIYRLIFGLLILTLLG